jgi:CO/xanthine dehydrogenase FAD-binding subunit
VRSFAYVRPASLEEPVTTGMLADERIGQQFPPLIEAASGVGSIRIRNRATLADNTRPMRDRAVARLGAECGDGAGEAR